MPRHRAREFPSQDPELKGKRKKCSILATFSQNWIFGNEKPQKFYAAREFIARTTDFIKKAVKNLYKITYFYINISKNPKKHFIKFGFTNWKQFFRDATGREFHLRGDHTEKNRGLDPLAGEGGQATYVE